MNELKRLLEDAKRQSAASATYDQTGAVRHIIPKAPASVMSRSLRELSLPPFLANQGLHQVRVPLGTEAGKKSTFSSVLLQASRVSQAGARIILVEDADDAQQVPGGGIALQKRNAGYTLVEAANFALVADGAQVADSTLPVYRDLVDLDTMPAYGFRVALSRAEQRQYEDGELADNALVSIALGIARTADAVLLSAIATSTPANFSLGAAAALGVEFAELRALVGTAGNGAAVGQDGTLRAAGTLAELTPVIAETIVGSFSRAAVAVHEDIRLVAERTNKQGELILTCWMNAQALLPLPGAFWKVAA
ncbi:hypothetical protein ACXVSK_13380 [Pseudomonas aeruginosa]|jgi:hypothetical protein|uniref:hypothetical protein n=1 Tax=Pseudomonas aeruginosa TaxID=287 RepID=UPI00068F87BB|nr:hypothetical protein [Pseudomonas aeruginosa]AYK23076.1 hypothetical protein PA34_013580 [Pseudomonas aeruginosa]EKX2113004.1 hypothetical protein [Pseudomonas aeruginosa]EKY4187239.1 hypothetical protein [Pseudomonas aeruginosa]ELL1259031.1 hypothetical protein [Pseudomonas aeruginosa]ELT3988963.1 hypothetical protein [Pseudomonas aeruginosa]